MATPTIEYHLSFAPRKTLAIHVHPDLRVTVKAPTTVPLDTIAATVRKRGAWILRKQREFREHLPHLPPRQYVSGETHRYLGRQYRLKVEASDSESVKLTRGHLHVYTPDPQNRERVRHLLDGWYRVQAERIFAERLALLLPRFARYDLPSVQVKSRTMKRRWGSCSDNGSIRLNLALMQVPKPYIDYVLAHELCHLIEHNHSPRFYALLDQIMPDWRGRRQGLNACEVA